MCVSIDSSDRSHGFKNTVDYKDQSPEIFDDPGVQALNDKPTTCSIPIE